MEETVLVVSLQSDIKSHNLQQSQKQLVVLLVSIMVKQFMHLQILAISTIHQEQT
jgi:hypothetical protein